MTKPKDLCDEALQIVGIDRRAEYGDVEESFDAIALLWSGILGRETTGREVALCMMALKLVRESHLHKRDNLVDLIGYTLCLNELAPEEPAAGEEGADGPG